MQSVLCLVETVGVSGMYGSASLSETVGVSGTYAVVSLVKQYG